MKKIKIIFAGLNRNEVQQMTVDNDLKVLQELVGGNIEMITLTSDLAMVVNEEGRLLELPDNQFTPKFFKCPIAGVFLIVGVNGDDFADWDEAPGAKEFVDKLLEEK